MSANNQYLLIPYKNKYVVFTNVIAEGWCGENMEHENEINLSEGKTFNTIEGIPVIIIVD